MAELGHHLVRPIVFPRLPERALAALCVGATAIVIAIASRASANFGGEAAFAVLAGGAPSVVSFMLMLYFVRRHRLKTENRAAQYDRVLYGLADG